MDEDAIIYRLNVIIALLLIVIGILLWPLLSSLLFVAFIVVTGGMAALGLWALLNAYW